MAICITSPLSGANLNPMVTIANCIKRDNRYKTSALYRYLPSQVLGSLAGILWS